MFKEPCKWLAYKICHWCWRKFIFIEVWYHLDWVKAVYKRAIFKKWHLDMIEFSQILNYKCIKSVLNILSIVDILFTINNLPITRLKDIILYIVHWYSSHVTLKCPVVTKTLYHSFLHKILRLLCNCWLNIRYQSLPLPHRKTIWCQH